MVWTTSWAQFLPSAGREEQCQGNGMAGTEHLATPIERSWLNRLISHTVLGSHLHLGKPYHQVTPELLPYHTELHISVGKGWLLLRKWAHANKSLGRVAFSRLFNIQIVTNTESMALSEIKYLCCVLKYTTVNQCSEYDVVAGATAMTVTRERPNGLPL